ncbi:MAG: hypothetical protein EOP81_02820 [Variovorax sp.]|nr:MAG: hypothetical protein EOP81_02820 [Variovorax sp.]
MRLPEVIEAQSEIDKVLLLRAAGLVEADIPPIATVGGRHLYTGHAVVMAVTRRGQAVANGASLDASCDAMGGTGNGIGNDQDHPCRPQPQGDTPPRAFDHPAAASRSCRA